MTARPLRALLLLLLVPPLAGALLAPLAYRRLLPMLHGLFPDFAPFDEPEFPRIVNRCVLAVALVLLWPALRWSGLGPALGRSLRLSQARLGALAATVALGLVSMGVAYGLGWLLGGYRVSNEAGSWQHMLVRAGTLVFGAVFVGLFEETFFRGVVFGAVRTRLGFWPSAGVASLFFTAVHFLQPEMPATFDATRWSSGLALFAHVGSGFEAERDRAFACTLFLMGLTLCRLYERDGHLWRAIGLHGGWVWAMQIGAFALDHNWAIMRGLLGPSDYVAQGHLAIPIIALFLGWSMRPVRGAMRTGA